NAEPSMKLAALPDAAASSVEAKPPDTIRKQDAAAELRAKRRARARLRARRLALARARAERLAQQQQQQAATNSLVYKSGVSTTPSNTASAMNATSFGQPRAAP